MNSESERLTSSETRAAEAQPTKTECTHLLAQLSIQSRGRHYYYRGYRYDRAEDAIAYARLKQSTATEDSLAATPVDAIEWPSEDDSRRMADLSISFENGVYLFGTYRYDRLVDAVNYAELGAEKARS